MTENRINQIESKFGIKNLEEIVEKEETILEHEGTENNLLKHKIDICEHTGNYYILE